MNITTEAWCSRCERPSTTEDADGTGYCDYHAPCPQCGGRSVGRAFARSARYIRCGLGHVWYIAPAGRI